MQKCMNEGKPIYAFDILGQNDIINFEMEKKYRMASKKKLLKCCECGKVVIFRFKNLEKKKPHFSHLKGTDNESCGYWVESEEHMEGKKLLLDHMRNLYPGIYHEMRYKVMSINRYADLYFKLDDKELIIEFQRIDLDIEMFERKLRDYNSLNINSIWILSGSKDELNKLTREHNLTFFQRLIVNDMNNLGIFLDVKNREITMMSKIVYIDEKTKKCVIDQMFCKTYPLDEVVIHIDGMIETNFKDSYEAEKSRFIEKYREKINREKEIEHRNLVDNKNKSIQNNIMKGNYMIRDRRTTNKFEPNQRKLLYKSYKRTLDEVLYSNNKPLNANELALLCYNNISIHEIIGEILREEIKKGSEQARNLYDTINKKLENITQNKG